MHSRLLQSADGARRYALVLESGEETVESITAFARQHTLLGASLSAIGAFSHAELGYFNPETSEFVQNSVSEQTELLSLIGNISIEDGHPHVHAHVVLGCRDATTRGGHLVAGWVRPTLELIIEESPHHMRRRRDVKSGLVLLLA